MIYRKEAALVEGVKSKEISVLSKVGKTVCFKVLGFENGMYILSRKAAQAEALDYFMENLSKGDVLKGRITHTHLLSASAQFINIVLSLSSSFFFFFALIRL